jgi:hypothetical protein
MPRAKTRSIRENATYALTSPNPILTFVSVAADAKEHRYPLLKRLIFPEDWKPNCVFA